VTNSAYAIIRGLTMTGARHHGIQLGTSTSDDVHDIVIEGNDISRWGVEDGSGFGTPMDSAVYSNTSKLTRVVIQGNRMTSPTPPRTGGASRTTAAGTRPARRASPCSKARATTSSATTTSSVTPRTTSWGIGATANFGYSGFPGKDSDIYGNYIAYARDDGIEAEGGGMNVCLFDNYLTEIHHAFSLAAVSLGPLYVYRNVQDVARCDTDATYGQAMFKMGGNTSSSTFHGDGRTDLFHNTALKLLTGPQNRKAIEASDGRVPRNTVSLNNILRTRAPSGSYCISDDSRSTTNSFDYDLYNGLSRAASGAEPHGIKAEPVHVSGWGMDRATRTGRSSLAAGSPGVDRGVPLPGSTTAGRAAPRTSGRRRPARRRCSTAWPPWGQPATSSSPATVLGRHRPRPPRRRPPPAVRPARSR
jgi:hypothetical protein